MKTLFLSLSIFFIGGASVFAQSAAMERAAGFFEGVWKSEKETYESWEKTPGSSLRGMGYKIKDGKKMVSENLEIKEIDGKLFYLATVPDQNDGATVKFALTASSENEFSFENPEHDFPKKIIYKKESPCEMFVQVLGDGGNGFSFKMIKVSAEISSR